MNPASDPATETEQPEASIGQEQHLDVLDALRGIASLLVLSFHMHAIASIYRLESPAGVWVDPLSAFVRGGAHRCHPLFHLECVSTFAADLRTRRAARPAIGRALLSTTRPAHLSIVLDRRRRGGSRIG